MTLENAYVHPRKSQRVYRSPSSPSEPSPYAKIKQEQQEVETKMHMEIDAEDEEAGSILMALSKHADRLRTERASLLGDDKPSRSHSMSITSLLDDRSAHHISPSRSSHSSGFKPYIPESRRNYGQKKGFQICLTQRNNEHRQQQQQQQHSFRHPSLVRVSKSRYHPTAMRIKRSTAHVHISYRIHAHQTLMHTKSIQPSYPRSSTLIADHHHHHHNSHHRNNYTYQQDV